jgi:hypothetical protein
MKKTFITAIMLATAAWYTPEVHAQGGTRSVPVSFKIATDPSNGVANPEVSALAKKTQVELYSGADGLIWEAPSTNQSVCSFTLNNTRHRAAYDNRGTWRWTVKSYAAAGLSQEIKNMLIMDYGNVTIQWVDEVTMPDASANYFVVISSDKLIRRVRVVEDKTETLEEFAKQ